MRPGETRSPDELQDMLAEVILAAGGAVVPGVGPKGQARRAPARVRKGSEARFKAWQGEGQPRATTFPGSGEPMTLYHGTAKSFNEFKPGTGGAAGPGIYLAKTPELANTFAGGKEGARVLPVHARGRFLKMPFNEAINAREWAEKARREGYDGLDTGLGELVVFTPQNIKSAIGNRGTYNPSNPDIRE